MLLFIFFFFFFLATKRFINGINKGKRKSYFCRSQRTNSSYLSLCHDHTTTFIFGEIGSLLVESSCSREGSQRAQKDRYHHEIDLLWSSFRYIGSFYIGPISPKTVVRPICCYHTPNPRYYYAEYVLTTISVRPRDNLNDVLTF